MKKNKKNNKKIEEKKIIKLDVACGQNKQPNFVGIDIVNIPGVDIVHDLNIYPWPIESESVEEIFCSHFVEHVGDLMKFMDECHRILIPGGNMIVMAPYYTSLRCWQDPTHVRAISEASFLYYNKNWRIANKLDHYPIKSDFDFVYGYVMTPDWASRNEETRTFAIRHYWNVVSDINVKLTKK